MNAFTVDGYPWPLTIIRTRYGGIYEGGQWAAFNQLPGEIPYEAMGEDSACVCWWTSADAESVGRGNSPMTATADLMKRQAQPEPDAKNERVVTDNDATEGR